MADDAQRRSAGRGASFLYRRRAAPRRRHGAGTRERLQRPSSGRLRGRRLRATRDPRRGERSSSPPTTSSSTCRRTTRISTDRSPTTRRSRVRTVRTCARPRCRVGRLPPRRARRAVARANYLKRSSSTPETAVAMMSGIPAPNSSLQLINNDAMAETRNLGKPARRVAAHARAQGMLTPNFPERRHRHAYRRHGAPRQGSRHPRAEETTGAGCGVFGPTSHRGGWTTSGAYPMLGGDASSASTSSSSTRVCASASSTRSTSPRDIPKAAKDWPNIRFGIITGLF